MKDYKKGERPLEAMPLKEVKAIFEAAGFKGRVVLDAAGGRGAGGRDGEADVSKMTLFLKSSVIETTTRVADSPTRKR